MKSTKVRQKMTKETFYTLQLLNKSYKIKCAEAEEATLQLAAQKLNEQLIQKKSEFKNLDNHHALILAALHISHELVTCQSQQKEQRQQLAKFIDALETKISQVAQSTA